MFEAVQIDAKITATHGAAGIENVGAVRFIDTVSYTHLDVYKRQIMNCAKACPKGLNPAKSIASIKNMMITRQI